jgi:Secretion system C-terminal sorting domain
LQCPQKIFFYLFKKQKIMAIINFLRTSALALTACLMLSISVTAQITTNSCVTSDVNEPYYNRKVSSFGVFNSGITSVGTATKRQVFSVSYTGYTFDNRYTYTVNTPNLTLVYFEIVKGAREAVNVPGQGLRTFQDASSNGTGNNVQASFSPTGTFTAGIAWTDIGSVNGASTKGYIRFFGYTGNTTIGYTLVEYKCLEVTIPPAANPTPPCGYIKGTNSNTGATLNTVSFIGSSGFYVNFTSANYSNFTIASSNSNYVSSCGSCSSRYIGLPSAGTSVNLTVTPTGTANPACNNPVSSTFTFVRSSCTWCLVAQNNPNGLIANALDKNEQMADSDISVIEQTGNVPLEKVNGKSIVFPNPASGSLNVNTPPVESYVQITNMLGQEVYRSSRLISNTQEALDVSNVQNGLYIISFKDNTDHVLYSQKLILK